MSVRKQIESRRDQRIEPLTRRLVRALRGEGGRNDQRVLNSLRRRRKNLSKDERRALEIAESQTGQTMMVVAHQDTMARPVNTNVETT